MRSPTHWIYYKAVNTGISIHRLLAEPDKTSDEDIKITDEISIHRLLAEPDTHCSHKTFGKYISIHRLLAEPDEDAVLIG